MIAWFLCGDGGMVKLGGLREFAKGVAEGLSRGRFNVNNSLKRRSRPVSVSAEFAVPARILHMSSEDLEPSM